MVIQTQMWPLIPMSVPLRRPGYSSIHRTVILKHGLTYIPGNLVMGHTTIPSNRHIFQTPLFTGGPYQQMVDLICRTQRPPRSLSLDSPGGIPGPEGSLISRGMHPPSFTRTFPSDPRPDWRNLPVRNTFCAQRFHRVSKFQQTRVLVCFGKPSTWREELGKPKSTNKNVCP